MTVPKPTRGRAAKPKPEAESTPVEVTNVEPLVVEVVDDKNGKAPAEMVTKGEGATLAPTTTEESDRVTSEQRRISAIWEYTQAAISIVITASVVYCQIYGIQSETLNNAFFFVIATYLQRTNHTRVGGIGAKPDDGIYRGR